MVLVVIKLSTPSLTSFSSLSTALTIQQSGSRRAGSTAAAYPAAEGVSLGTTEGLQAKTLRLLLEVELLQHQAP